MHDSLQGGREEVQVPSTWIETKQNPIPHTPFRPIDRSDPLREAGGTLHRRVTTGKSSNHHKIAFTRRSAEKSSSTLHVVHPNTAI